MKTSNQVKRNTIKLLAMLFAIVAIAAVYPKPANAAAVTGVAGPTTLNAGSTGTVTATLVAAATESQSVTWSTSNSSVVSVLASGATTGTVTAVGAGTAVITATPDEPGGTPASMTITVPTTALTGISVSPSRVLVLPGGTVSVTLTFTPANATNQTVTWTSSNPAIATVNPTTGVITGVAEGTTTVTVTSAQGPYQDTVAVTVGPSQGVTGIKLDKSTLSLKSGSNAQLTATVFPSNASNKLVKWTSSNTSVATVDATGRVLAVSKGTATITATTDDGSYQATCSVSVDSGSSSTGKYDVSYSSGTTFKSNGAYKDLSSVSVDGRTLSKNAYSAYSGSGGYAYVKLSDALIESLSNGTHTLTMNFSDGSGSATFGVDRTNKVPNVRPSVVPGPYTRPSTSTNSSKSSSSSKTTSKKGGISASDSNKYIIDEKIDEGVFETVIAN